MTTINGAAADGSKIIMSGGSLAANGGINFSGHRQLRHAHRQRQCQRRSDLRRRDDHCSGGTLDIGNAISQRADTDDRDTTPGSVLKLDGTATAAGCDRDHQRQPDTGNWRHGRADDRRRPERHPRRDQAGWRHAHRRRRHFIRQRSRQWHAERLRHGRGESDARRTGGANTITASGGTLDLTGTFGTGLVAAIGATSASDLKFDSTGTVAAADPSPTRNQTLEVDGGALTLTGAQNVSLGKILMSGGTLSDSSGIVLGNGTNAGTLTGFGTVSAARRSRQGGTGTSNLVEASGGTLILSATIGAATGLSYQIADTASSVLELDGTVGAGNTFTFLGAAGDLAIQPNRRASAKTLSVWTSAHQPPRQTSSTT